MTSLLAIAELVGPLLQGTFMICSKVMADGYKVVGPNGQYITLSASGCLQCDGTPDDVGEYGYYWSSTPHMDTQAFRLAFDANGQNVMASRRCYGRTIRLVKQK